MLLTSYKENSYTTKSSTTKIFTAKHCHTALIFHFRMTSVTATHFEEDMLHMKVGSKCAKGGFSSLVLHCVCHLSHQARKIFQRHVLLACMSRARDEGRLEPTWTWRAWVFGKLRSRTLNEHTLNIELVMVENTSLAARRC